MSSPAQLTQCREASPPLSSSSVSFLKGQRTTPRTHKPLLNHSWNRRKASCFQKPTCGQSLHLSAGMWPSKTRLQPTPRAQLRLPLLPDLHLLALLDSATVMSTTHSSLSSQNKLLFTQGTGFQVWLSGFFFFQL